MAIKNQTADSLVELKKQGNDNLIIVRSSLVLKTNHVIGSVLIDRSIMLGRQFETFDNRLFMGCFVIIHLLCHIYVLPPPTKKNLIANIKKLSHKERY